MRLFGGMIVDIDITLRSWGYDIYVARSVWID